MTNLEQLLSEVRESISGPKSYQYGTLPDQALLLLSIIERLATQMIIIRDADRLLNRQYVAHLALQEIDKLIAEAKASENAERKK